MTDNRAHEHKGHILSRLNAGRIFARFLDKQFKALGAAQDVRRQAAHAVGLYTREEWQRLKEEVDRLEGMLESLTREGQED